MTTQALINEETIGTMARALRDCTKLEEATRTLALAGFTSEQIRRWGWEAIGRAWLSQKMADRATQGWAA